MYAEDLAIAFELAAEGASYKEPTARPVRPEIGERWNHRMGRREWRAYPQGVAHPDGGAGPWVPDRDRAVDILTAALTS